MADGRNCLKVADRWYSTRRRLSAYGYCTDSEPKAPTRSDGETYKQWTSHVQERSGEYAASQDAAWRSRRGRSSRRALQGQIVKIFAAVTPQGRLQIARGGFFPAVSPHHVEDHGPIHHFTVIPTAGGATSAAAAKPRIAAAGGAASHDRKGANRGRTSTDTGTLRKRCARMRTLRILEA